jgi:hypothetical protein
LASLICCGLLHSGENIAELATMMNIALAYKEKMAAAEKKKAAKKQAKLMKSNN